MTTDLLAKGIQTRCLLCPESSRPYDTKGEAKSHVLTYHAHTREMRRHPKRYIMEIPESKKNWLDMLTAVFNKKQAEKKAKQREQEAVKLSYKEEEAKDLHEISI